jgi:hypothetical protein
MIKPDNDGVKVYVHLSGQHTYDIKTELKEFYNELSIAVPGHIIQNEYREQFDV